MSADLLTYEFIQEHGSLTWAEALWGCEHGIIDWNVLKELAMEGLCKGSERDAEVELAGLTEDKSNESRELARQLASLESTQPEAGIRRKWLRLVLTDLFLRRHEVVDALAEVETIYADFGYPEEIESFVRYMPASDGYDPRQHTHEENMQRLYQNWADYITQSF